MRTLPPWAQEIEAKVVQLNDRIPRIDEPARSALSDLIAQASALARLKGGSQPRNRVMEWWYGSRVEQAWALLHEADLLILETAPPALLPVLLEEAIQHAAILDQTDPARVRLVKYVEGMVSPIGDV